MALVWSESVESFDWEALTELFEASPPMGNKRPAELKIAFGNSMFRCFVHDGAKLVGVGRALADGVYVSYLGDIAVHPDYRGAGLGKQIVAELLRRSAGHKKVILYAAPGAEGLYAKFGFRRMRTAMALFENQEVAMERGYLDAA